MAISFERINGSICGAQSNAIDYSDLLETTINQTGRSKAINFIVYKGKTGNAAENAIHLFLSQDSKSKTNGRYHAGLLNSKQLASKLRRRIR